MLMVSLVLVLVQGHFNYVQKVDNKIFLYRYNDISIFKLTKFYFVIIMVRGLYKGRPLKIEKNRPLPLVCKMSQYGSTPSPLVHAANFINFKKSENFCVTKCRRPHLKNPPSPLSAKCPHWTTFPPPLPVDVFYGLPIRAFVS